MGMCWKVKEMGIKHQGRWLAPTGRRAGWTQAGLLFLEVSGKPTGSFPQGARWNRGRGMDEMTQEGISRLMASRGRSPFPKDRGICR